jgi:hypothetical protein
MLPEREGLEPSYEQRKFPAEERRNRLQVVASPDGREGSLVIRQDALLYLGALDARREVAHVLLPGRHAWLQVLRGTVRVDGRSLSAGDGASVSDEPLLTLKAEEASEVLVFDLA